jgi:hypothetical protein
MSDGQGIMIPLAPETVGHRVLRLAQSWLPVLTVVGGALWALYTYLDHQAEVARNVNLQERRDTNIRLLEARKPFLEKQLALYFETAAVVGKIVTITPDYTREWPEVERRFWELYWSELAMVEDEAVEAAMVKFSTHLSEYKASYYKSIPDHNPTKLEDLKKPLYDDSLELSHAIRDSIFNRWDYSQPIDYSQPPVSR